MAEANGEIEPQIIKLENEWIEAIARRDAELLEHLLGDHFTIAGWLPNGQIADRSLYLADCLTPVEVTDASYSFEQWRIQVHGRVCVVNFLLDSRAKVFGKPWGGRFLLTDVWLKEGGRWRAVTRHTSPVIAVGGE